MASSMGKPRFLSSFDGTQLAVYEAGNRNGPSILLFNGLGGNIETWTSVVAALGETYHFVSFDYRGMFASGTPPYKNFTMDAHARDALTVLEHFGVSKALFMGWSMGVQVALEVYSRAPQLASGIVLINGVSSRLIDKVAPGWKRLVLLGMDLVALYYPVLKVYATPITMSTTAVKVGRWVRFLSSNVNERAFLRLAHEYIQLDFANYRDIVYEMAEHDADHVLPTIQVPALIVGGTIDRITPPAESHRMAAVIPGAELLMMEDASHYSLVEYPDLIILRVAKFLNERVFADSSQRSV